jgi:nucleotide-binding universal stress UspA family protein
MPAIKRILIPYDFSETSAAAVRYGLAVARTYGARVILLHVGTQAHSDLGTEFPLGLEGAVEDAVRERLLRILTPAEQSEFKPELAVRPGVPAAEIVQYAEDQNVDLIVMGTHGRGFVGHFVMGSVAEKVVRTAPCPVLTIRNPREKEAVQEVVPAAPRVA